jgi:hypothetical protein
MTKGCTVCWLVEQNANLAFDLVESVYFLEVGTITIEGKAKELVNNDKARKTPWVARRCPVVPLPRNRPASSIVLARMAFAISSFKTWKQGSIYLR